MKIIPTTFDEVLLVELTTHTDDRGYFIELFNKNLFAMHGIGRTFIQDNHSFSHQSGTIRGLHYQLNPKAQSKLVRVMKGAIYDVVVDIRTDSETIGKWESFLLTEDNHRQLFVPKGFAHGFCTLVRDTEVQYKVDEYYSREHERGIRWNTSELHIDWPMTNPILSAKDKKLPDFSEVEKMSIGD
ncbi:dTDP-4-dehydrorhamnose 3,5-epimerase [Bacillus sp. FSL K6-3431]|uniref:dTDP-4-dehydrorhamnose 3,5-epimerase n=1 Tax=Bacillus sp. FSL K6-3431 TaxID=2921500 RepID=UPI0030F87238